MRFRELFEAEHTAVKGDTLWALSKKYGVSIADIAKASGIADPNKIKIGQKITIPGITPPAAPAAAAKVAPIPAAVPSFRQPKIAAVPPMPRPDPRTAKQAPELQTLAPPPMATLPPNKVSANPANATGMPPTSATQVKAPSATVPKNPLTGPGGMTGTPPIDPVAAAKAKAAEAGQQAAALQAQIDAGNASLAAKQKAATVTPIAPTAPAALSPQQLAKQARDEKAFAGTATPAQVSTAPSVVDDDPTTDSPAELQAAQDDIFKDRLAQADADDAQGQSELDAYVKDPIGNADRTGMGAGSFDGINSATLGKWAQDQEAKKAAAAATKAQVDAAPPKPGSNFDIANYLRTVNP